MRHCYSTTPKCHILYAFERGLRAVLLCSLPTAVPFLKDASKWPAELCSSIQSESTANRVLWRPTTDDNTSSLGVYGLHDDTSLLPGLLASFPGLAVYLFLLTIVPARIVANQPLRAKEASPFVSSKYPVIVCSLLRPNTIAATHNILRTMNTMLLWLEPVAPDFVRLSDWQRQDLTPLA